MTKEVWKDVIGYEGRYQVSNLGRVKSLERLDSIGRRVSEKILKKSCSNSGYESVTLTKFGVIKTYMTHILVASAFVPNPHDFPQVNHKNEIKTDNRAKNLEWMTNRANLNYSTNKRSSSKYPGVCWNSKAKKWMSQCKFNGKQYYFGLFKNEEDAAQAYIDFCKKNDLIFK